MSFPVLAEETPPAPEEATPPAAVPEAAPPPAPPPEPPPPAPAPPPPSDAKAFSAGGWLRLGGRIQNPSSRNQMNDVFMDEVYVILSAKGEVNDWLKWQFNLNGNVPPPGPTPPPPSYPSIGIQDLIVKVEPNPAFNLWFGRMLVAVDRSNLSGPWFINYFLYPGFYRVKAGAPIGLKTGPSGREEGVQAWGQFAGGKFKYYLGAFELSAQQSAVSPLYTGRINIDLLDPEPGFYHQSAYHGKKDIIAIGGGFQFQKNGSARPMAADPTMYELGDLKIFEADLLVDKKLGTAGVGTLEAAAYFLDDHQPVRKFFMFGAGYVLPEPVGPGQIAPAFRYQFTQDPGVKQIDGYIQYLVKSHLAKFFLGGFWADMGPLGGTQKAIQLGIQIIKL